MAELFRHRTEKEFGRIEDSHGTTSMKQELKVKHDLKGFGILEFFLVEKRTKNKCPCASSYIISKLLKNGAVKDMYLNTYLKCPQPCRIMFQTTTRIIGFLPEKVTGGPLKMSLGNLKKTEKKGQKPHTNTKCSKNVFYEVNLASHSSHLEILFTYELLR